MSGLFYVLAGFASGIFGGMGMGGGTVLIPLLTLIFNVEHKQAQGINLLVFIPTAVVGSVVYAKENYLDIKSLVFIGVPAVISAVLSSLLLISLDKEIVKTIFGWFLIVLGTFFLIINLLKIKK